MKTQTNIEPLGYALKPGMIVQLTDGVQTPCEVEIIETDGDEVIVRFPLSGYETSFSRRYVRPMDKQ